MRLEQPWAGRIFLSFHNAFGRNLQADPAEENF